MKRFDRCLKDLLSISGVSCKELARHLGVSTPVIKRWMNGNGLPDLYQFREIARFFQMPYAWFLDDEDSRDYAEILAERLGLSEQTVDDLIELTITESKGVLEAVDDAIFYLLTAIHAKEEAAKTTPNKSSRKFGR